RWRPPTEKHSGSFPAASHGPNAQGRETCAVLEKILLKDRSITKKKVGVQDQKTSFHAPGAVTAGTQGQPGERRLRAPARRKVVASGELLAFSELGVGLLGFLQADVAVTVEIECLELLGRAEELARRDIAIAVAVHLAEPQRAGGRGLHRR